MNRVFIVLQCMRTIPGQRIKQKRTAHENEYIQRFMLYFLRWKNIITHIIPFESKLRHIFNNVIKGSSILMSIV